MLAVFSSPIPPLLVGKTLKSQFHTDIITSTLSPVSRKTEPCLSEGRDACNLISFSLSMAGSYELMGVPFSHKQCTLGRSYLFKDVPLFH